MRQSPLLKTQIVGSQKILTKSLAEVNGDFPECAFALDKVLEVPVNHFPFGIFFLAHLLKVGEKILLLLGLVNEAELTVDYLLLTSAADKLAFLNDGFIVFLLDTVLGLGIDIESQMLTTAHPAGAWVADSQIVVQIERNAAF